MSDVSPRELRAEASRVAMQWEIATLSGDLARAEWCQERLSEIAALARAQGTLL